MSTGNARTANRRGQLVALMATALLAACAQDAPVRDSGETGVFKQKIGRPYQIAGVWYYPQEDDSYDRVGIASWYGEPFHGRKTANGEVYDMERLTAAHTTLPLPTYVEVTNLENNRSIVVKVNDRGPFVDGRLIDLSRAAARELGFVDKGLARVRVRVTDPPSGVTLVSSNSRPPQVSAPRVAAAPPPPPPVRVAPKPEAMASAPLPDAAAPPRAISPIPAVPPETLAVRQPVPEPQLVAAATDETGYAASGGSYRVQAGVFSSIDNALRVQERLLSIAPVEMTTVRAGERDLHRVRLGPFRDRETASRALAAVRDSGLQDALIVTQ